MVKKNRKNNTRLNFFYKVSENGKEIDRCQTRSKRRFLNRVRTIKWEDRGVKTYLRINYGKHMSVWGKIESFWNDGEYDNEGDFLLALEAFLEDV